MTANEVLEYNNAVFEAEAALAEYNAAIARNDPNLVAYYNNYVNLTNYANALYRSYNRTFR